MKKVIFAIFAAGALGASGAEYLTSPDGRLRAEVWTNDSGTPMYSLTFDGDTVVRPSRLGLLGDRYDLTGGSTSPRRSGVRPTRSGARYGESSPRYATTTTNWPYCCVKICRGARAMKLWPKKSPRSS